MQEVRAAGAPSKDQVLGLGFQKEAAVGPQGLQCVHCGGDTRTPQWLVRGSAGGTVCKEDSTAAQPGA